MDKAVEFTRRRRGMERAMRGSVTKILGKLACGFVLTERGDELFFGSYALDGIGIDDLKEGQCVEIEFQDPGIGPAAIKRVRREHSQRDETPRCA
jgi:cold shock CspA family protein